MTRDHPQVDLPESVRIFLVADGDSSVRRYASWLSEAYETQRYHGARLPDNLGADVVVVDQLSPLPDRQNTDRGGRNYKVIATAATETPCSLVDAYIDSSVTREELLREVETVRRVTAYEDTIAELLSLTTWRRKLQDQSTTGRAGESPAVARVSERINELHNRIDDTLADVESRYVDFSTVQSDMV